MEMEMVKRGGKNLPSVITLSLAIKYHYSFLIQKMEANTVRKFYV